MSGRRGIRCALLGLALAGGVCGAAERLAVVHDAGGTVLAAPHVSRAVVPMERIDEATAHAAERLAAVEEPASPETVIEFPVMAAPLRGGRPERIAVRGLGGVLFAIGADPVSVAWLEANAWDLRARGAAGLLVDAESPEELRRMRELAARHGLSLDPMPGSALAEAFGARSYPFVAEPSQ